MPHDGGEIQDRERNHAFQDTRSSERLAGEATRLGRYGPAHGRLLWSAGTRGVPALQAWSERITGASRFIVVEPFEIEGAAEGVFRKTHASALRASHGRRLPERWQARE